MEILPLIVNMFLPSLMGSATLAIMVSLIGAALGFKLHQRMNQSR